MIQTWNTYKKKNNPAIWTIQDSVFNKPMSIEPTLIHEGFKIFSFEINTLFVTDRDRTSPRERVISKLENIDYNEAVYYVWNGRDLWTRWITVGYK